MNFMNRLVPVGPEAVSNEKYDIDEDFYLSIDD